MLPRILDTPAKCNLKIKKSTLKSLDPNKLLKGGYNVHPPFTPFFKLNLKIRNHKETGRIQNDNAFNRGKTKSGAFNKIGSIQFPKNPINVGITKKKIIRRA